MTAPTTQQTPWPSAHILALDAMGRFGTPIAALISLHPYAPELETTKEEWAMFAMEALDGSGLIKHRSKYSPLDEPCRWAHDSRLSIVVITIPGEDKVVWVDAAYRTIEWVDQADLRPSRDPGASGR